MNVVCIYLSQKISIEDIEQTLHINFKRTIEKTFCAQLDKQWIFYTKFNVLSFVNYADHEIKAFLKRLNLPDNYEKNIHETYPLIEHKELQSSFHIDSKAISLKAFDPTLITIIVHVISQSVALELFEINLEKLFRNINALLTKKHHSLFSRKRLITLSQEIALFRHEMVLDLYLLDKPNILWENEIAEELYNELETSLELKERFEVLEYKLNSLKDDVRTIIELLNHKHSSFLEWIIIWLIAFEIGLGLLDLFKQ